MAKSPEYLDPKTLAKVDRLEFIVKSIVEGFLTGLHKSPFHGYSVEFAEHREYTPGDDLRHLDWKALAKSDRYFIKQYEEETNMRALVLLDTSESMAYGSGALTKYHYGAYIAASLVYMMVRQGDSPGLALFNENVAHFIPPSSSPAQLWNILSSLSKAEQNGGTRFDELLSDMAPRLSSRGMVILISDLFHDPDTIIQGLRRFRHRRHDVMVFQTLDHDELNFPFDDLTRFVGMESHGELNANPRALRQGYLRELNAFLDTIKKGCRNAGIAWTLADTSHPLDVMLGAYLARRMGKGGRRG